jgi:head-tail adaptor
VKAGQLNQPVVVSEPVRTRDAIGGTTVTWRKVADAWCSVWPVQGSEAAKAGKVSGAVTHEVRLRRLAAPDMKSDYRLTMGSRTFDVVQVLDVESRGEMWRCMVAEHVD